ncbi:hypothetical protein CDL12_23672 [Handroanthus impetiginosus]|uniref:DUF4408 domain-containing protein n=1 Tax=Handroanthus impetiginosus TaxID=429701 RepID=A0A2G9GEU2_9LAMI|nr:hypothetical protein CDL12_23672 [Handroanthus impetiginosus]
MHSFNFHDIKVEKANAILRYRRIQRIATLFRFVEVFVFLIILSRFSAQFAFSLKLSGEYFRGISVTLISPRFVFLIGNAIVIVLFLKSGRFSPKNGEKIDDLYEEYVEKCRQNQNQQLCIKEEKKVSDTCKNRSGVCNGERIADFHDEYADKCQQNQQVCNKDEKKVSDTYKYRSRARNGEKIADFYDERVEKGRQNQQVCSKKEKKVSDTYKYRSGAGNGEKIADFYDERVEKGRQNQQVRSKEEKKVSDTYKNRSGVCFGGRKMNRSQSEKLERIAPGDDRRRELQRSMTEKCRKGVDYGQKAAPATYAEDEMSSEEFRRTVEEFIARHQRLMREEQEHSPVVPLIQS